MFRFRGLLHWCAVLALSALVLGGCSDDIEQEESINSEQLEGAILKIVSGDAVEAINILGELNNKFPDNTVVMNYLGEAHREAGDYLKAAFWYEQVAGLHPNGSRFLKLAGHCYELAREDESAIIIYSSYASRVPEDGHVWRKLYQLRYQAAIKPGRTAKERSELLSASLDAFNKVKNAVPPSDLLKMARIFREKNILPQAERMFRNVYDNPNGDNHDALLGLLDVYLAQPNVKEAESTIKLLNKDFPGAMDNSPLAPAVIKLLMKRHPNELGSLQGEEDLTVRELFAKSQENVVAKGKPPKKTTRENAGDLTEIPATPKTSEEDEESLADFFDFNGSQTSPAEDSDEPQNKQKALDFLQRAEFSTAEKNYQTAQFFLREAIKEDPSNPKLWYQRSKVHYLAGELKEAKMTATETVRLTPNDLDVRLHYLRIVRLVMIPERLLQALEKAKDRFPASHEIVWQLARHYHHLESNNNAATILYRSFLELAPPGDPRRKTAQDELDAISQP